MSRPAPIQIRDAAAADLAALVALEQSSFVTDRLTRRQYRHHLSSPSARVLVAVQADQLAGAAVTLFRRGTRVARLYSLAVSPDARGHGVGRALVQAVEQLALARGCCVLCLEVRVNNPAAIALYERGGFTRSGQRTAYYEDGAAAWRYQKNLLQEPWPWMPAR